MKELEKNIKDFAEDFKALRASPSSNAKDVREEVLVKLLSEYPPQKLLEAITTAEDINNEDLVKNISLCLETLLVWDKFMDEIFTKNRFQIVISCLLSNTIALRKLSTKLLASWQLDQLSKLKGYNVGHISACFDKLLLSICDEEISVATTSCEIIKSWLMFFGNVEIRNDALVVEVLRKLVSLDVHLASSISKTVNPSKNQSFIETYKSFLDFGRTESSIYLVRSSSLLCELLNLSPFLFDQVLKLNGMDVVLTVNSEAFDDILLQLNFVNLLAPITKTKRGTGFLAKQKSILKFLQLNAFNPSSFLHQETFRLFVYIISQALYYNIDIPSAIPATLDLFGNQFMVSHPPEKAANLTQCFGYFFTSSKHTFKATSTPENLSLLNKWFSTWCRFSTDDKLLSTGLWTLRESFLALANTPISKSVASQTKFLSYEYREVSPDAEKFDTVSSIVFVVESFEKTYWDSSGRTKVGSGRAAFVFYDILNRAVFQFPVEEVQRAVLHTLMVLVDGPGDAIRDRIFKNRMLLDLLLNRSVRFLSKEVKETKYKILKVLRTSSINLPKQLGDKISAYIEQGPFYKKPAGQGAEEVETRAL
eukprot:snap_masked-scaffold_15-processed-gene-6.24-mRNA-1 protein AED:0.06 eAED:1.00 QI:0/-1/0/1/-1/1/1/0/592